MFYIINALAAEEDSLHQTYDYIPDASYAFTIDDEFGSPTTHIILDRVKEGNEKAVFLHEVGGHIGFDNIIPLKIQLKIANQINF